MNQEIRERLNKIPQFVVDAIYEDYVDEAIGKIMDNYIKTEEQVEILKNMIGLTALKDIRIEQLFLVTKESLDLDDESAKEVTLVILCEIFHPIKDYFPGIEDEILRLGGEIPQTKRVGFKEQLLKREEEMDMIKEKEEMEERMRMADAIIEESVLDLLKKYPKVGEQQIGSQKEIIIENNPVPMKPLIKYWIKDYREKMGYIEHSNIERGHYVYHDKNTKEMNEEERRQLNLVLKSVDENIPLPYSTRTGKIDFSKIEE